MGVARSEGYTIIEVSLFLGISALLLTLALVGTGLSIRSTRFTDSTRSLHAYVQEQYDNLLNGVNPRTNQQTCNGGVISSGNQTPGTSNCIYMGKLIVFPGSASTIHTYDIIGTEPPGVNYNQSDVQLIYNFSPTVITSVGVDNYDVPWQAAISGSKRPVDGIGVDALAFIRSPGSTRIVSYTFKQPGAPGAYSLPALINPTAPADANNISQAASFCLSSADGWGQPSKITVSGGQGQDAIGVSFDAVAGDCNGS